MIVRLFSILLVFLSCLNELNAQTQQIFSETFTNSSLPAGWSTTIQQGMQGWSFRNSPGFSSSSGGYYAVFDDELLGALVTPNEATLESPSFSCVDHDSVYLKISQYWYGVEGTYAYLDIRVGSSGWINLMTLEQETRGSLSSPHDTIFNITSLAANETDVQIRFRYSDGGLAGKFWYIDDVTVFSAPNLGAISLISPVSPECGGTLTSSETITMTLRNYSHTPIDSVPVVCIIYNLTAGTNVTHTGMYTGTINPGETVEYTFPTAADLSADAMYLFKLYTNHPGEAHPDNDTTYASVRQIIHDLPYAENFDLTDGNWTPTDFGTQLVWNRNALPGAYLGGPAGNDTSWYIQRLAATTGTQLFYLTSPTFDFREIAGPVFSADIKYALQEGATSSRAFVYMEYSVNNGASWARLGSSSDPNWYTSPAGYADAWSGTQSTWKTVQQDLCEVSGYGCVRFRFVISVGQNVSNPQFAVDNIHIGEGTEDDLVILGIYPPSSGVCSAFSANQQVALLVQNNTCRPLTNIPITIELSGAGTQTITDTIPGPIPGNGRLYYTAGSTFNMSATGQYNIKARVYSNTSGQYSDYINDIVNWNDTISEIRFSNSPITSYPFVADFDAHNFGFAAQPLSQVNKVMVLDTLPASFLGGDEGNLRAWRTDWTLGTPNTTIYLESPSFNLTSVTNPLLTMDIKYNLSYGTATSTRAYVQMQYSANGGAWTLLGSSADPSWYNGTLANAWTGVQTSWTNVQKSLCAFASQTCIRFRFVIVGGSNVVPYFAIDNFSIVDAPDAGVSAIVSPVASAASCLYETNENITLTVFNSSCSPLTNVPVVVNITGATTKTFLDTVPGPIPNGGSVNFTLDSIFDMTPMGAYHFEAYSNFLVDGVRLNDTTRLTINVTNLEVDTFPYFENFETWGGSWTPTNFSNQLTWTKAEPGSGFLGGAEGNGESWYLDRTAASTTTNTVYLTSPVFDFTWITNPVFTADIKYNLAYGTATSTRAYAVMQYTTDGGSTWNTLGSAADANWYTGGSSHPDSWAGAQTTWKTVQKELCSLSGISCVRFRIAITAGYNSTSTKFAIDNVQISAGTGEDDLQVIGIYPPGSGTCTAFSATQQVGLLIQNNTCRPLRNIPVSVSISGAGTQIIRDTISSTIPRNGRIFYTLTPTLNMSATGEYTIKGAVHPNPSGIGLAYINDITPENDTLIMNRFSNSPVTAYPYVADFEADNFGFAVQPLSEVNKIMVRDTLASTFLGGSEGNGKAWQTNWVIGTPNTTIYLESPSFNLTSVSNPLLTMDLKYNLSYGTATSTRAYVQMQYSANGGAWTLLGSSADPSWYNGTLANAWTGVQTSWTNVQKSLCAFGSQTCIRFRFVIVGGSNVVPYFAIDNFSIIDAPDAGVSAIVSPVSSASTCLYETSEGITLTVFNSSCSPISNVPVVVNITGATTKTFLDTVPGPIPNGGSVNFTLDSTFNMTPMGAYHFEAYTNFLVDGVRLNDTTRLTINVNNLKVASFPYSEDFEAWDGSWTPTNFSNQLTWTKGEPAAGFLGGAEGNGESWYLDRTAASTTTNTVYLTSPVYDFTWITNPVFTADIKYNLAYGTATSTRAYAYMQYTIDGGSTWSTLGSAADANWYTGGSSHPDSWAGAQTTWKTVQKELCSLSGISCVIFRIAITAGYNSTSTKFAIDNIQISAGTGEDDLQVIGIYPPSSGTCSAFAANQQISLLIQNNSCRPLKNIPVSVSLSGAGTQVIRDTITSTIPRNGRMYYTLSPTLNMSATGEYTIKGAVHPNPSGIGLAYINDITPENDTLTVNRFSNTPVTVYPYVADFEADNFGFAVQPLSTVSKIMLHDTLPASFLGGSEGNGKAWFTDWVIGTPNTTIYLESPSFNLTGVSNPLLTMDLKYNLSYGTATSTRAYVQMQYSVNGGAWTLLGASTDPSWYSGTLANAWTGTQSSWTNMQKSLCAFTSQACIRFRFVIVGGSSVVPYFAVDNFRIMDAPDVGASARLQPATNTCMYSANQPLQITVSNSSCSAVNNIPVVGIISGVINDTLYGTVAGPIPASGSIAYTFPSTFAMNDTGTYYFTIYTDESFDTNHANDTNLTSIYVPHLRIDSFPYREDFNLSSGYGGWRKSASTSTVQWTHGTLPSGYLNGPEGHGNSWYAERLSGNGDLYLVSPVFDLSSLNSPTLSFDIKYNLSYGTSTSTRNYARMEVSLNGGTTWTTLGTSADPSWYSGTLADHWTGEQLSWTRLQKNLCSLASETCVKFRIYVRAATSNACFFAIDNFGIGSGPDASVEIISAPSPGVSCLYSANQPVTIRVQNWSCGGDISNIPVVCDVTGVSTATLNGVVPGPLAPGDWVDFTFPSTFDMTADTGYYYLTAYTDLSGDQHPNNDTIKATYYAPNLRLSTYPQNETFEASSGHGGWFVSGGSSTYKFTWDAIPAGYLGGPQGNGKSWYIERTAGSGLVYLTSPIYDFTAATSPQLSMNVKYNLEYHATTTTLRSWARIEYSLNGGSSWTTLGNASDPDWYTGSVSDAFTGVSEDWKTISRNLCEFVGESCVKFRFVVSAGTHASVNPRFAIDNFKIISTPVDVVCSNVFGCWGNTHNVEVSLTNNDICGAAPVITSARVYMSIDGAPAVYQDFTGLNIPGGNSQSIMLDPVHIPATGSDIVVWAELPNGLVDELSYNDTIRTTSSVFPCCNDHCQHAIQLLNGQTMVSQTSFASHNPAEDPEFSGCGTVTLENTMWYYFYTNETGGEVTFNFEDIECSPSNNGLQITVFEIIDGDACNAFTSIRSEVFCLSPGNTDNMEYGPVVLPPNGLFYIVVDGYANNSCDFALRLGGDEALPIELLRFEGTCTKDGTLLTWSTATEIDNHYFTIQRSTDAVSWENIGEVQGAGNSNQVLNYSFVDEGCCSGPVYYRLRQTDFNGDVDYSNIIHVNCEDDPGVDLMIFPNPAHSSFETMVNLPVKQAFTLEVVNSLGKTVYRKTYKAGSTFVRDTFDSADWAKGIYYVRVMGDNFSRTEKLVKK